MICRWRDITCQCNTQGPCKYEAYTSRSDISSQVRYIVENLRPIVEAHDKLVRVAMASRRLPLQDATRPDRVEYVDALADLPPELLIDPATSAESEVMRYTSPAEPRDDEASASGEFSAERSEHTSAPPATLSEQGAERHDIGWAVARLKEGKWVKRAIWISSMGPTTTDQTVPLCWSDLLATDWRLAEIERMDRAEKETPDAL